MNPQNLEPNQPQEPTPPVTHLHPSLSRNLTALFLGVVIVGVLAAFGTYYLLNKKNVSQPNSTTVTPTQSPSPTLTATPSGVIENPEGKFCGGIANIQCDNGFTCKLDGSYPDAGGKCVSIFTIPQDEQKKIDAWIQKNNLNQYGDPKDTVYTGGSPLFSETNGTTTGKYEYIVKLHPDKPWN